MPDGECELLIVRLKGVRTPLPKLRAQKTT